MPNSASATASLTRFDSSSPSGDVLVAREFDKTVGEIGIVGGQRRLDILGDQRGVVPQSRIELQVGELGRDRPAPPGWRRRRGHAATAPRTPPR